MMSRFVSSDYNDWLTTLKTKFQQAQIKDSVKDVASQFGGNFE